MHMLLYWSIYLLWDRLPDGGVVCGVGCAAPSETHTPWAEDFFPPPPSPPLLVLQIALSELRCIARCVRVCLVGYGCVGLWVGGDYVDVWGHGSTAPELSARTSATVPTHTRAVRAQDTCGRGWSGASCASIVQKVQRENEKSRLTIFYPLAKEAEGHEVEYLDPLPPPHHHHTHTPLSLSCGLPVTPR